MQYRSVPHRLSLRFLAFLLVITPLLIASGPFSALSAAQESNATPAQDKDVDDFNFDLSGQQIVITGAQPEALGMTTDKSLEYLEAWGADIEDVVLTSTTHVQALIAGRSNIAAGGADELILGTAEGADLTGIVSTRSKMDYVLVAQEGIESTEDLDGATVGMSGPAGFDALLARVAVREAGLEDSDVNFVQIGGSGDRSAALLAGRIDAAVVFISDWLELQQDNDDLQAVVFMADLVSGFSKSLLFSKSSYWQDNPELATAVACATLEANEWFHQNKEGWIEYTLENVPGSTRAATSQLYDLLVELNMFPATAEENLTTEGMQGLVELMVENGDISEPVDIAEHLDLTYLQEAADMGCGQ